MRTNESRVTNGLANSLLHATPKIYEENVAETSTDAEVPWNFTKLHFVSFSREDNICQ